MARALVRVRARGHVRPAASQLITRINILAVDAGEKAKKERASQLVQELATEMIRRNKVVALGWLMMALVHSQSASQTRTSNSNERGARRAIMHNTDDELGS